MEHVTDVIFQVHENNCAFQVKIRRRCNLKDKTEKGKNEENTRGS